MHKQSNKSQVYKSTIEAEGENDALPLDKFSVFKIIYTYKVSSAYDWSGIAALIILICEWSSNLTRIPPNVGVCIHKAYRA